MYLITHEVLVLALEFVIFGSLLGTEIKCSGFEPHLLKQQEFINIIPSTVFYFMRVFVFLY